MPAPKTPVKTPVTFSFNSGKIQLTSVIDPETKQHSVTCDLCSQIIKLGIIRSINPISLHRDSEKFKRRVFKESKLDSKNRNLMSEEIQVMLFSCSNQLMSGWWILEHNTVNWRRQNNIPDSDGFEVGQTRKRSDTVSTAHSDSHEQKRADWERYKSRYYYKSLCSRICEITLHFYNLNSPQLWQKVSRVSTATFPGPPGRPDFTENSSAPPLVPNIRRQPI
jgi:hypothetical protein